jgi:5-methylcytosine-specific restriction endonuclease McrA
MAGDTLVLDSSYQPVSILPLSVIDWRQAIRLYFLNKVRVLECYDDWVIRSEKLAVKVPAVVVSSDHFSHRKGIKFSRYNLFLRDLFTCAYCEETFDFDELTIDHVIPRKLGGKTTFENTVCCCKNCNSKKGSKLWTPKRAPYKPDYYKLVNCWKSEVPVKIRHESWYQYIGIEPLEKDKPEKMKVNQQGKIFKMR